MNDYLRPPVFWALMSFAALLWVMCVFAGGPWAPYVLFVLGIAILATLTEWGIEQRWPEYLQVTYLYWLLDWHRDTLVKINLEINDAAAFGDIDEVQALRHWYVEEYRKWRQIRGQIVEARAALDGSIEGIDYSI